MGIPSDSVLAKKLRELESTLREAFVSGRNQETEEMREEEEREGDGEISKRIEFLRNLLCAEMESRPGSKPVHLYHIAERLARLEDAYQRWADGGSSPEAGQSLDNVSICSCTDSCFNEEQEGEQETPILDDPRPTEPHVSLGLEKSGFDLSAGQSKKGVPARAAAILATAAAATALAAAVAVIFIRGFEEAERTILMVPT